MDDLRLLIDLHVDADRQGPVARTRRGARSSFRVCQAGAG
jgi:hypothetical protein